MTFAQRQRAALLQLMSELGPFAPTMCDGWQTQDLAAHLYIREHKLAALPGIGSQKFAARTAQIQREELHRLGYLGLLEQLRKPGWIMRPVDRLVNAAEFFIHHEDVLRANGKKQRLSSREQDQLWRTVQVLARRAQLAWHGRLILERSDRETDLAMGQGNRPVRIAGLPSELLLFFSGRKADIQLIGEPEASQSLQEAVGKL